MKFEQLYTAIFFLSVLVSKSRRLRAEKNSNITANSFPLIPLPSPSNPARAVHAFIIDNKI